MVYKYENSEEIKGKNDNCSSSDQIENVPYANHVNYFQSCFIIIISY